MAPGSQSSGRGGGVDPARSMTSPASINEVASCAPCTAVPVGPPHSRGDVPRDPKPEAIVLGDSGALIVLVREQAERE